MKKLPEDVSLKPFLRVSVQNFCYCFTYLLLTEFEGRTVSYRPSFRNLQYGPRLRLVQIDSTDRENEVSKIFIISLLCV